MRKVIKDYEADILRLVGEGLCCKQIADTLGLKANSLLYYLNVNNIHLRNGKFKVTPDIFLKIKELYIGGESSTTIGEMFNLKPATVCKVLKDGGVKIRDGYEAKFTRGITFDQTCFTDFTKEDASYWYGLLLSDGCLNNGIVSLGLKPSDKYMLDAFKAYTGSSAKVHTNIQYNKQAGKEYQSCVFYVKDKNLEQRLREQGFSERKSCSESPPKFLTNSLADRHFWRGYIDGDGYVRRDMNNPELNIIGGKCILLSFRTFCESNLNVKLNKIIRNIRNDVYSISYTGQEAIEVMKVIWSDYTLCLKRKEDIVLSAIKYREEKNGTKQHSKGKD